ncbi:MAG: hypothetical protein ACOYOF_06665 [Verrucomicrobiaceae bacterium]
MAKASSTTSSPRQWLQIASFGMAKLAHRLQGGDRALQHLIGGPLLQGVKGLLVVTVDS